MTIAKSRGRTAALGSFTTALLASAAYFTVGVAPASAAICLAANDAQFDACVTSVLAGDTIQLTGPATLSASITAANIILQVDPGGSLVDTGFSFGPSTAVVINGTGSITTSGLDTFASLAGNGTLNIPSLNAVLFGNTTNTAFSGTLVAPDLNTPFIKQGTGTFTVNGMTAANGDFLATQGTIAQTSGTTNIKSIAVGTGTGNTANMTVSGGTLTFTGTGLVGSPCFSQCPALRVGDFFGTGVLTQSAGTVNIGAAGVAGSMNIGNQGGNGTYNMSGGTLNLGVFGDVNSAGLYAIGRQASASVAQDNGTTTGVFNISGGTVNVNAGELINGDRDAGGAVNVTTNSTINLSGGTLSVKAGANLWLSAHNNNAVIDSIFNLSGTGILEVGDGSLQAAYGGGAGAYQFNLNGGQIRVIGSDLTTTVNGILQGASATAGTQLNTNGLNANWNGILSGTGWLVKTGAGTLNLGGVNTYTGGTAFNGGTVLVDAASDLGTNAAGHSFNGGTLQLGANNVLNARTGATSMLGAGTIDTAGFASVFDTAISGSGALTVTGGGYLQNGGNSNAHSGALNVSGNTIYVAYFGQGVGNSSAVTISAGSQLVTAGGAETIGSLAGAGAVTINDGFTLTTGGNNSSTVWSGTLNQAFGVGSLTKVGTGTFTINGNTSYTGLTTVSAGELKVNGTMADSLLIQAGARFSGNATISGNVTNSGAINPGNSPGSVIIAGNYIGGGVLNAEVQFNNAGAPVNGTTHDFLSIGGNASGTTLINVIPSPPSGAATATTLNGIELVRVAGTTGAGQFALAAPVFVGAYEYTLNYLQNYSGALDGYFLQSRIGEGLFGDAAMAVAGKSLISNCFRSTDELAGDGNRSTMGRAWAKVSGGNMSTGADTGLETDQDYTCGSGGLDLRVADGFRVGVSGGYGNTDVDVTTLAGTGKLEGDGGMMSTYVGYSRGNMFANVSLGYGNINWTYQGPLTAERTATTSGVIGAMQAGMLWPMGDWRLGATAELAYDGLECGNHCMLAGTQDDVANWTAKAGLRLDGTLHDGKVLPFLSVALSDSLDGTNSVSNGGAVLETETQSSLLNARAGVTAMIAENTAIFLSGGITEGLSNDVSGAEGTVGAKLHW